MNFLFELPRSENDYNGIWVIVERLTKITCFLSVKVIFTLDRLAKLYVDKPISQYGALESIVYD